MNGSKLFVDTNILLYFLNGDQEVVEMISDKEIVLVIRAIGIKPSGIRVASKKA